MKAFEAILITIAIVVFCTVVSLATDAFGIWALVVIGTAIWATIDAKKIQISKFKVSTPETPLAVFFTVLFLWIVFFPVYLVSRGRIRSGKAELRDPNVPVEVVPSQPTRTDIPKSLDIAVKLLWLGFVIGAISMFTMDVKGFFTEFLGEDAADLPSWFGPLTIFLGNAAGAGITWLLVWLLKSGRNWVRWLYIVGAVILTAIQMLYLGETFTESIMDGLFVVAGAAVTVAVVVNLVRADSNAFFNARPSTEP